MEGANRIHTRHYEEDGETKVVMGKKKTVHAGQKRPFIRGRRSRADFPFRIAPYQANPRFALSAAAAAARFSMCYFSRRRV